MYTALLKEEGNAERHLWNDGAFGESTVHRSVKTARHHLVRLLRAFMGDGYGIVAAGHPRPCA